MQRACPASHPKTKGSSAVLVDSPPGVAGPLGCPGGTPFKILPGSEGLGPLCHPNRGTISHCATQESSQAQRAIHAKGSPRNTGETPLASVVVSPDSALTRAHHHEGDGRVTHTQTLPLPGHLTTGVRVRPHTPVPQGAVVRLQSQCKSRLARSQTWSPLHQAGASGC